jgi:predicted RNase H-like HicB family nuclease
MRRYTIILTPDTEDGGFVVTVPALPGCVTQGDTVDEAMDRAREAIEGFIEALDALGQPIPEEHAAPTLVTIQVA